MAILHLFKSHPAVMGYVFKEGKTVHFIDHQFATANQVEIDELTAEIKAGHTTFYIDPNQETIDSEQMDPYQVLVARIREEERAKILAATRNDRDMGETTAGKLEGISTSASIVGLQAGSESQAKAANTAGGATVIPGRVIHAATLHGANATTAQVKVG